eukprot:5552519-Prymnesium_polylepis.1
MPHRRHPARCLVVRDTVLRAACAQHVACADAQPQTPPHAAAAVGDAAAPQARAARPAEVRADGATPRANARKRRSLAAVLRAARSATRRARSPSAQPQTHCSTSSGCAGS